MSYLWIAIGAGLGGALRHWCSGAAVWLGAETFPWGTLFINVFGSAFIGFFAAMSGLEGRWLVSPNIRLFVMTGICGGFTTFSTFSLETLRRAAVGDGSVERFGVSRAVPVGRLAGSSTGEWMESEVMR